MTDDAETSAIGEGQHDAARRHGLRALVGETALYGLATVSTGLLNVVLTPLYARSLPPNEVAVIALVNSLVVFATILASFALENAAQRWYWDGEDPHRRRQVFTTWFWWFGTASTVLAIGVIATSSAIARLVDAPDAGPGIAIAALSLPLRAVVLVSTNWARARRSPVWVLVLGLAQAGVAIPLTVWALRAAQNRITWVFAAQTAAFVVVGVVGVPLIRQWFTTSRVRWDLLREMLRFAAPLVPAALASWAMALADRWFLALWSTPTDVAVYQVAVTYSLIVGLPVAAFQQAWGPFALSAHESPDAPALYRRSWWAAVLLLTAGAVVTSMLAEQIIPLVFGATYEGARTPAVALAFGQIFAAGYTLTAIGFSITKHTRPIATALLVAAAVDVVGCALLIPHYGAAGAGWAMLAAQGAMCVIVAVLADRRYPVGYRAGPVCVAIGAAAAASAAVAAAPMAVRLGVAAAAAATGLAATWVVLGMRPPLRMR
jgi:O-antigen/teichoic acid export membrane protein